MVPAFKPYLTMQFVKNYLTEGRLYCETSPNGQCSSVASAMCKYMNDCSGNGACNSNGKCMCNPGFFGADCSTRVTDLTKLEGGLVNEKVKSSRWLYYAVPR